MGRDKNGGRLSLGPSASMLRDRERRVWQDIALAEGAGWAQGHLLPLSGTQRTDLRMIGE